MSGLVYGDYTRYLEAFHFGAHDARTMDVISFGTERIEWATRMALLRYEDGRFERLATKAAQCDLLVDALEYSAGERRRLIGEMNEMLRAGMLVTYSVNSLTYEMMWSIDDITHMVRHFIHAPANGVSLHAQLLREIFDRRADCVKVDNEDASDIIFIFDIREALAAYLFQHAVLANMDARRRLNFAVSTAVTRRCPELIWEKDVGAVMRGEFQDEQRTRELTFGGAVEDETMQ
jgi:hypothetical protein